MRAHRSTILFGALALGLVLTQQACTPEARQTGSPDEAGASATPAAEKTNSGAGKAPATGTGTNQILAGKRQVVIKPVQSAESILALDGRGRLSLIDGEAEHSLFVITPVGDRYLIKTAKADTGGEPSCLGIKTNGSDSLSVEAAACDTRRDGQLFTITKQKDKDRNGRPTYAISNQSAFLQASARGGLIAEELGDAPLKTTYAFVDNGPVVLPALD